MKKCPICREPMAKSKFDKNDLCFKCAMNIWRKINTIFGTFPSIKKFNDEESKPTDKYKHCNHHHELTSKDEIVDFGDGKFVANKMAVPLLKALNDLGLRTRTHHMDNDGGFISMLIDDLYINFEIKEIFERDAVRTKYNGKHEILISWSKKNKANKLK